MSLDKVVKLNALPKCTGCKKRYDLSKLADEADIKGYRNLYCPHCGRRVGQLQ